MASIKDFVRMCCFSNCKNCKLGATYRLSDINCFEFILQDTEEAEKVIDDWNEEITKMNIDISNDFTDLVEKGRDNE